MKKKFALVSVRVTLRPIDWTKKLFMGSPRNAGEITPFPMLGSSLGPGGSPLEGSSSSGL